jgi:UDP-N-acetylmuramoyl-tripeptide--D-alanyl-D-alanine ligase
MASQIPTNGARFSHRELVAATSGQCPAFAGETLGVWTDSRAAQLGGLFVALRGERFDGHDFVAGAVQQGAQVVVAERAVEAGRASVCRVPSTLGALGDLARAHRLRWGQRIVGVAGSVGKTTTRSAVSAVAKAAGLSLYSPRGNLNNLIGVPMVLFGLEPEHALGVVEIGTNQRGEVARLVDIARPDIAVLTRISLEHSEGLGDLDAIEEEEGALFRGLQPDGVAVLNADDARCVRQAEHSLARRQVRYGLASAAAQSGAVYRIAGHEMLSPRRTRVRLERPDARVLEADSPLLGLPGAYALAAAVAVSETLLGRPLTQAELESALASNELGEPGRLTAIELADGSSLLDDSYNASPASMRSSVAVARELSALGSRRLLLVLGEMRELGALSESSHRELGHDLGLRPSELLIAFGGHAKLFLEGQVGAGARSFFADDALGALSIVRAERRPGDVILVKASFGLGARRVVEGLRGS